MCATLQDGQSRIDTIQQLADAVGGMDKIIIESGMYHSENPIDFPSGCCLCPVDIEETCRRIGWKVDPIDGDTMDLRVTSKSEAK